MRYTLCTFGLDWLELRALYMAENVLFLILKEFCSKIHTPFSPRMRNFG